MTQFGLRIEPITSPTPGGCATSYATGASSKFIRIPGKENSRHDQLTVFVFLTACVGHIPLGSKRVRLC